MEKANKTRKLPAWMSRVNDTANSGASSVAELLDESIPYLLLQHKPVYSYEKDDSDLLCDDLIERLESGDTQSVIGFDMEWPVTYTRGLQNKTATIQLCLSPSETYIFQLSAIGGLSPLIQKLLSCPKLKLAGLGIERYIGSHIGDFGYSGGGFSKVSSLFSVILSSDGDLWKLARDFEIDVRLIVRHHMVDLSVLANSALNTCERWNLDNLTKHLLRKKLNKNPEIRTGDWSRCPLTDTQITYAATDALACYLIYQELLTRRKP